MHSAFDQQLLSDVIFGHSQTLEGLAVDDAVIDDIVNHMGSAWIPLRQWMILDVLLPAAEEAILEQHGLRPRVVFACAVGQGADAVLEMVLSGFERDFQNCLFQSADDELYLLAGRGARKWVSVDALGALKRHVAQQKATVE